jgi:hypothetical protein
MLMSTAADATTEPAVAKHIMQTTALAAAVQVDAKQQSKEVPSTSMA